MENQIGQIANALLNRQPDTLPSDTEVPGRKEAKEHVKAITLRSGEVADAEKAKEPEAEVVREEDKQKEKEVETRKTTVEHTIQGRNSSILHHLFLSGCRNKSLISNLGSFWRCSRNFTSTYLSLRLLSKFLAMQNS